MDASVITITTRNTKNNRIIPLLPHQLEITSFPYLSPTGVEVFLNPPLIEENK